MKNAAFLIALYDYSGDGPSDLVFAKGDVLLMKRKVFGWWTFVV